MFARIKAFLYPRNVAPYSRPNPGIGYTTALMQFQGYPRQMVQGAGTLTGHNSWMTTQPPQQMLPHIPPAVGGVGTFAGQIAMQPLIDTRSTGSNSF